MKTSQNATHVRAYEESPYSHLESLEQTRGIQGGHSSAGGSLQPAGESSTLHAAQSLPVKLREGQPGAVQTSYQLAW